MAAFDWLGPPMDAVSGQQRAGMPGQAQAEDLGMFTAGTGCSPRLMR
jgi:hypothetical protein